MALSFFKTFHKFEYPYDNRDMSRYDRSLNIAVKAVVSGINKSYKILLNHKTNYTLPNITLPSEQEIDALTLTASKLT